MAPELDTRQRAMLKEMGVHVWLPATATPLAQPPLVATAAPAVGPEQVQVRGKMRVSVPNVPATAIPLQTAEPLVLHAMQWPALVQAAGSCQACGLCAGRKRSTLAAPVAVAQADWMVVGDPPDEDEDRLGQPFVEQAGDLLDNMLKAVAASRSGQGRQGAYLSNIVKCRPPPERLPQAAELAQCAHYVHREMQLVQPKVMVAMGRFAVQMLLAEHPQVAALPLDKQRGHIYSYRGTAVVVTYHPKVLLRASANKAKAWADLCLAKDALASLQLKP